MDKIGRSFVDTQKNMEEKIKEIIGDLIGDIDYSYAAFISPQAAEDYIQDYTKKILECLKDV